MDELVDRVARGLRPSNPQTGVWPTYTQRVEMARAIIPIIEADAFERAAKVADGARDWRSYQSPTDWDYGAQDASGAIADAIRSLGQP